VVMQSIMRGEATPPGASFPCAFRWHIVIVHLMGPDPKG
jgi:hypothetical protein